MMDVRSRTIEDHYGRVRDRILILVKMKSDIIRSKKSPRRKVLDFNVEGTILVNHQSIITRQTNCTRDAFEAGPLQIRT